MIDDKLMDEHLDDEVIEQSEAEKEAEAFLKKLEMANDVLNAEGENAGLCFACLGTDKLYVTRKDGYEGIQYVVDNEIPSILKCSHGAETFEDMPF